VQSIDARLLGRDDASGCPTIRVSTKHNVEFYVQLRPIRPVDMRLIDELFGMQGGYVLDFSNKTFAEFFDAELGVDIDDPQYAVDGDSKAKRLRQFLKVSEPAVRARTLQVLWEYRETTRQRRQQEETVPDATSSFESLILRVGDPTASPQLVSVPVRTPTRVIDELRSQLSQIATLDPQPRGYAFERFLKQLFDAYGLSGRASFRLVGEQIDGSFALADETYLLEAKWRDALTDAADLRSFNGKCEDKAQWTRGFFLSYSGFSEDGLAAFGRGKRVVCMNGTDLRQMLERAIPFPEVMRQKVRFAGETGQPFTPLSTLFPKAP
jgi:hypothetical protein